MGSRTRPNWGGSGFPNTRKSKPPLPESEPIQYEPIKDLNELEIYLSGPLITCLMCGKEFKNLGIHLAHSHAISAKEYKVRFNIPVTRSIAAPILREVKASIAKNMWRDNPKMAHVRKKLKRDAKKNLSNKGSKAKRRSSLAIHRTPEHQAYLKKKQLEAHERKFRPLYLSQIKQAIAENVTLYTIVGSKSGAIYNFANKHPNDTEFNGLLSKVLQTPTVKASLLGGSARNLTCPVCNSEIKTFKCKIEGKYEPKTKMCCSKECAAKYRKSLRPIVNCVVCNKEMSLPKSSVGRITTCSKACSSIRRSKTMSERHAAT